MDRPHVAVRERGSREGMGGRHVGYGPAWVKGKWVIGWVNMSDPSGKRKYSNFYLRFSKRTEKDLTREKWLEVSGKSETLASGRLHYLEQLSY
jgi:hypothetical protein